MPKGPLGALFFGLFVGLLSSLLYNRIMERLAAIDLGSNAVRLVIAELDLKGRLTINKKFRIPLRLGSEAFSKGFFTDYTLKYASKAFEGMAHIIQHEKVDRVYAVATSASRDVKNSKDFTSLIKNKSGIQLDLISGDLEAELIRKAIQQQIDLSDKESLLMDIGGGSMELTLIDHGRVLCSKSFQLGTVRILQEMKNGPDDFEALDKLISKSSIEINQFLDGKISSFKNLRMVGTGGNFRRMLKLKRKIFEDKKANHLSPDELEFIYQRLCQMPYLKRMKKFDLRPDWADVIIPAIRMTIEVLKKRPIKKIYCPDVGLVQGVLFAMADGQFKEVRDLSST